MCNSLDLPLCHVALALCVCDAGNGVAVSVNFLGSLVASSGRVDNEVGKHITQAFQAFGVLQKSVCLDNPLYCMWRPGTPYTEICSSFIYYSM